MKMIMSNNIHINVLVTLNEGYLKYLNTLLESMIFNNRNCFFSVYILSSGLEKASFSQAEEILGCNGELILIKAQGMGLENAPTSSRYPKEMYYRIFAARYLPETLDRILYLDPDIIINGQLSELYNTALDGYFFAAASHNGELMRKLNERRLKMEKGAPYINSGVLLINLELLRKEQNYEEVFEFIELNKHRLLLPDQDIISSLYGGRIYKLDKYKYNMTERLFRYRLLFGRKNKYTLEYVRSNSVIIHYCGKNKPWKEQYSGKLNVFYNESLERLSKKRYNGENSNT